MKHISKRQKRHQQEGIYQQVTMLLAERGSKALEQARKEVLQEQIECKEVREALTYFMTEYWQDLSRPTLVSLACEAVGGDQKLATRMAVPMILISGAIDIHDDIIDQSKVKASRSTVLGMFGKEIALVAGDMLMVKGFELLCEALENDVPAEKAAAINLTIQKMLFELGDAEALELKFRRRTDITPEEYLSMVRKKAADVEAYTRVSAILGGVSTEEIEALGEYGRLLGTMVILKDDLADMTDLEELMHRIKMESFPFPVIYALQNREIESAISLILLKKITKGDVKSILAAVDKAKGLERVEKLMLTLAENAHNQLKIIKELPTKPRELLTLLLDAVLLPFDD